MRRLAAAVLLLVATHAWAQPALRLDGSADEVDLEGYVSAVADASGALTFDDVRAGRAGAFRPVSPVLTREQMLPAAVWIRLRLRAPTSGPTAWALETPAERAEVYWVDDRGAVQRRVAGIDVPKAERAFPRGYPAIVPFLLDRGETRTVWARVAHDPDGSESTRELRPFRLKTATAALRDGRTLALANGLFFGFLLALALYNLALYAGFRDASFLYYVAYVVGIGLYFATTYRVLYDAFWPDDVGWTPGLQTVAVHVAAACYPLFVRRFLGRARIGATLDRLLLATAALSAGGLLVIPTLGWAAGGLWTSTWVLGSAVLAFAAMGRAWRGGYGPAGALLGSFVVLAGSTAGFLAPQFGLPRIEWAMEMMQVGIALEALLLALALTSRGGDLRSARARALVEAERAEADRRSAEAGRRQAEEANAALQEALRLKSDLLGFAAHDLRSPLANVLGFADLIREDAADPRIDDYGRRIQTSAGRLLRLIDDLLVTAALEGGDVPVRLATADLGALVEAAAGPLRRLAEAKGQRFALRAAPGCHARLDADRFEEVLDNLVSNAVKYTPPGGTVEVEVRGTRREVWLCVADSGPGLTEADRAALFRPFAQLSARPTAGETSTGLGLSIVQRIVELHGGRIDVDSAPGRGARFTVVLDAAPRPLDAPRAEPPGETAVPA